MATLTTGDIKTVDELAEIGKDELANEDSLLTFDKDMNCHKKFLVSALRAWMLENERESGESARAAAASATLAESWAAGGTDTREGEDTDNASYYAGLASSGADRAEAALANLSGQAAAAESWAAGGTGTRDGEDTDNASYYATQAAGSATAAASSEANAAASETNAASSETSASASETNAQASAVAAASSETNAAASATAATASEANAAISESNAADSAMLVESWATGGTDTREGEDTDNAKYYAEEAEAALHDIRLFDGNAALIAGVRGKTLCFWNKSGEIMSVDVENKTLVI